MAGGGFIFLNICILVLYNPNRVSLSVLRRHLCMLYVELPPISETRIKILVEQCFRRWVDERDFVHLANAGKYMSAMAAVALKITYTKKSGEGWLIIFFITSSVATIYQVYWDLVIDWGLLRRNSRNKWLRDQLLLDSKWIYFASMVRTLYAALSKLVSTSTLVIVCSWQKEHSLPCTAWKCWQVKLRPSSSKCLQEAIQVERIQSKCWNLKQR